MCYGVYISTDSREDLSLCNSDLVRFEKVADSLTDTCIALLEFPFQWYVGSKSKCSCTFRHLHPSSIELGFSEPQNWYPEEQDELDATKELYAVIDSLLISGCQVDLLDMWEGTEPGSITAIDVSFDDVSATAFRMFENYKFRLRKEKAQQGT